jgi:hypothetical protein
MNYHGISVIGGLVRLVPGYSSSPRKSRSSHRVDADTTVTARGVRRGNITAAPEDLSYLRKGMTAAGLYTVTGPRLPGDGVFRGTQP